MKHRILGIASLSLLFYLGCNPSENKPESEFPEHFGNKTFDNPNNPVTSAGFELGRFLFYDKRLSSNDSISCASCHRQELAFTDGKAQAVGVNGRVSARGSMMLANLLWSSRFHWDGKFSSLEEQALAPISNPLEMNLPINLAIAKLKQSGFYGDKFAKAFGDSLISQERLAKALAQFTRSLISSSSKYDLFLQKKAQLSPSEDTGRLLFLTHPIALMGLRGANCGDCHFGALVQGDPFEFRGFHNNGLDDDSKLKEGLAAITQNPNDKGKFKAPSLRNITLTAPYMHDGRFKTLKEVLDHYDQHIVKSRTLSELIIAASNNIDPNPAGPIKLGLTENEKKHILAFLNTLTDLKFTSDKRFSDPFTQ
jgi:cytochrome c peroxidase